MQVFTNHELIVRKARVARLGSLFGIALAISGLALSFFATRFPLVESGLWLPVSYAVLLLGFIIGSYGNRQTTFWVQEPRADQALTQALKGLDDRHTLYNFLLPAPHVLLAPYGVFVLKAKGVDGRVYSYRDRWRRNFSFFRLLRGFAPEPLGNPTKETKREIAALKRFVSSRLPDQNIEIEGIVVFTHPQVYLEVAAPGLTVLPARSLKPHLRKIAKRESIPASLREDLQRVFEETAAF